MTINNAVFKNLPTVTESYDLFDPVAEISWTDSIVTSQSNLLATCGPLTWSVVMAVGGSTPDTSIFTIDVIGPTYKIQI